MEKKFNLSKYLMKGFVLDEEMEFAPKESIKEFIKRLKGFANWCPCYNCKKWRKHIDKLAGERLVNTSGDKLI